MRSDIYAVQQAFDHPLTVAITRIAGEESQRRVL